jgi:hypothetical protein
MQKRKHVKRTPGSRGQKNGAEKRFQDQAIAAERRTSGSGRQKNGVEKGSRIRRSMRKKEQKENVTEKRFQDQAVRIRRHMKRSKYGGLVPCDFLLGSVEEVIGVLGLPLEERCRCVVGLGVW